jgi:hypothetical protein
LPATFKPQEICSLCPLTATLTSFFNTPYAKWPRACTLDHARISRQALRWRELRTRQGDRVRFCLSDAFLPSAEELVVFAMPDEKVEGTVIDFSDSGSKPDYFAVVDVVRRRTVVVSVEKVEIVPGSHTDPLD